MLGTERYLRELPKVTAVMLRNMHLLNPSAKSTVHLLCFSQKGMDIKATTRATWHPAAVWVLHPYVSSSSSTTWNYSFLDISENPFKKKVPWPPETGYQCYCWLAANHCAVNAYSYLLDYFEFLPSLLICMNIFDLS